VTKTYTHASGGGQPQPRTYPTDIQPLLQSLFATLADIDYAFQVQREKLDASDSPAAVKAIAERRLREAHQERRAPYIEQLACLHRRLRSVCGAS
jgi:hypothetical protein